MRPAANMRRAAACVASLWAAFAGHWVCAEEAVVDPPGRVARLSHIEGEVTLAPSGSEEWADAVLNRPLTSGDRLSVAQDGRAELQAGAATIHLDGNTDFGFIELDDDVMQMSLTGGAASIRVRRLGEREIVQVETPNATAYLRHAGEYNFEIDPTSERTFVKARSGEAEVIGNGNKNYRVRAGEEGVFSGLDDALTADIGPIPARTAFESWANDRDRRYERAASSRYVSRDVIGYEDLDGHGEWVREPEYGYVWRPMYVAHDWAPYRYGRWVWVGPWGWTWVDDARWGFAPFHYGRWAYLRHRWCWVPGPRHLHAVYAPALVGWVGGPSVSLSISFGSIGWFPLAPYEVYVPAYRHTPRYIRHVNVSNTIIINNTYITNVYAGRARPHHYRHRTLVDATTVVHRDLFAGGRPIGGQRVRVSDSELRQWRDDARAPAIAPQRQSILAGEPRSRGRPESRPLTGESRPPASGRNPKEHSGGDFRRDRRAILTDDVKRQEHSVRDARGQTARSQTLTRDGTEAQRARTQQVEDRALRERENAVSRDRGATALTRERRDIVREERALQDSPHRDNSRARPPVQGFRAEPQVREQSPRRQWSPPPSSSRQDAPVVRESRPEVRQSQPEAPSRPEVRNHIERRSDSPPARQHSDRSGGDRSGSDRSGGASSHSSRPVRGKEK